MINETIYERQNLIKDLTIPKIATIIGLGGTGFWTAIFLAMSGVKELILVDSDKIEKSNLNRLPLRDSDVNKFKVIAVKEYIEKIRDNCRIEVHNLKIDNASQCSLIRGVIFCCTDNLTSQQLICAYAKKNDLQYQRIGYDGTILNVSEAFPLSFEEKETQTGYTVTPSWVIPAVFSAAAGVSSKLYKKCHLMDDIGKVHILNSSSVPEKIRDEFIEKGEENIKDNISDYISDDYGLCSDCNRVDPDEYGYCRDCEKEYSQEELDEKIEKAVNKAEQDMLEGIEEGSDDKYLNQSLVIYIKSQFKEKIEINETNREKIVALVKDKYGIETIDIDPIIDIIKNILIKQEDINE